MDDFQQNIFNPKDSLTILLGILVSLAIAFYKVIYDAGKRKLAQIGQTADNIGAFGRKGNTGFALLALSAFVFSIIAVFTINNSGQLPGPVTRALFYWSIFSLVVMNLLYLFQYNPYYRLRILDNSHLRGGTIVTHSIILTLVAFLLVRQLFYQYVLVKQLPLKQEDGLSMVKILLLFLFLFLNILVLGGQQFQRARSLWFRQLAVGLLVVFVSICLFIPVTKPFQKGYVLKMLEQDNKQVKAYLDSMEKMTRAAQ
ncbi:MAG: hypothetical protein ACTHMC_16565 [Pseudobacter sp.]|uniref:hypothetical protein n=1 Tax=Pseudobacter sp. TaxID=2045420 RepID=UPI003F7E1B5F